MKQVLKDLNILTLPPHHSHPFSMWPVPDAPPFIRCWEAFYLLGRVRRWTTGLVGMTASIPTRLRLATAHTTPCGEARLRGGHRIHIGVDTLLLYGMARVERKQGARGRRGRPLYSGTS